MKASYKIDLPKLATATLTITMTVEDWIYLRDRLNEHPQPHNWAMGNLRNAINETISGAEKHFNSIQEVER